MARVTLLHVSDLHLVARRGFDRHLRDVNERQKAAKYQSRCDRNVLRQCIRTAYSMRDRLDAVLVTGDLADSGDRNDLEFAKEYVFGEQGLNELPMQIGSRELQSSFASLGKPVIVLPGNHDRYHWANKSAAKLHPQPSPHFELVFNWSPETIYLPIADSSNSIAIITADFSLKSTADAISPVVADRLAELGQGRVYQDRLDQLVAMTRDAKQKHSAIIWAVHFPPEFPNPALSIQAPFLDLVEVDGHANQLPLLAPAASRAGVRYLLCGHRHQSMNYQPRSSPSVTVSCVGTACCVKDGDETSMHVVEIEVDDGVIRSLDAKIWKW